VAKTIYIIDGHWQIYRAYYAPFRDLRSPSGEPTRATYVFTSMLLKLIAERRPDCLVMAMDSARQTLHRTALYPQYKIQRAKQPEDLPVQVQRIVQIVQAMGIPILRKEGFEADDIMATAADRFASQGHQVVLVSRDKDLDQVIGPNVTLYDPMKNQTLDAEALVRQKGFPPDKAVDVLALAGDDSDNVPGIPGVGTKTAAALVARFGSAEEVIRHADQLTPKLQENVKASAAQVSLAKQLVTLDRAVDIPLDLEQLTFSGVRVAAMQPIFSELGFTRLLDQLDKLPRDRVSQSTQQAPPAPKAAPQTSRPRTINSQFDYRCVDTPEEFEKVLGEVRGQARLAIDTQATHQQPMWAELVGIGLSWQGGRAVYIPLAGPLAAKTLARETVRAGLGPILADPAVEKVGHDLKYDLLVLGNAGFTVAGPMFDTMLAAYCLEADRGSYRLSSLALEMLNHETLPIEALLGKGRNQITIDQAPCELVARHCGEDADMALRLREVLLERLGQEKLADLFHRIEMALLPVLVEMERNGIAVDPSELKRQEVMLSKRADELRDRIMAAAGTTFNPDSPKQLADVLFTRLGLPSLRKTKTGPSTDVGVLAELAVLHEVPGLVLEYRQATKLLGTYASALARCIHPRTGRVHTSFNQAGTATGRLSSSDPNLQNIPIRSELGRQIRAAFVAGPGNVLISADYSQVELRILAHFCQDPTLLAAFQADQDIHRIVAGEVFGLPPEQVTPQQRARAKTVNFGIIYGQTAFGLAATLRIPRGEAAEFIAAYKARFPRIEHFLAECVEQASRQGYVETLSGRRRRIEGFDSQNPQRRALAERLAINSVVQGSAADLIKIAMINVHQRLSREHSPARMLLQIHDELLFECPRDQAAGQAEIIRQEMTSALALSVPLKVDIGIGPNWRDAK
jgi:DNA polymerase-1